MLKRVLVTGCSHAFGSEMGGRGDNAGHDKLGFGPLLAEKLDLPLLLLARPEQVMSLSSIRFLNTVKRAI